MSDPAAGPEINDMRAALTGLRPKPDRLCAGQPIIGCINDGFEQSFEIGPDVGEDIFLTEPAQDLTPGDGHAVAL